jgi:hypothetical protein
MSRPGIEPGATAWEASTLEKSHLESLFAGYLEPLLGLRPVQQLDLYKFLFFLSHLESGCKLLHLFAGDEAALLRLNIFHIQLLQSFSHRQCLENYIKLTFGFFCPYLN